LYTPGVFLHNCQNKGLAAIAIRKCRKKKTHLSVEPGMEQRKSAGDVSGAFS
jgi:hypothetical protein